MSKMSHL